MSSKQTYPKKNSQSTLIFSSRPISTLDKKKKRKKRPSLHVKWDSCVYIYIYIYKVLGADK